MYENAVRNQIWITASVFWLAAIVRKKLDIEAGLYTFLDVVSVSFFGNVPLLQHVAIYKMSNGYRNAESATPKQLSSFD